MAIYEPIPVAGTTFRSGATFDVFLYKATTPLQQLKLTIRLRIKLRQRPPGVVPLLQDFDGKPFWIKPWTDAEWQTFIAAATVQAEMWNNKFWLVPPPAFSEFDLIYNSWDPYHTGAGRPDKAFRPNIRCELKVDFNETNDPHLTIDVGNLNLAVLPPGAPKNSGTFRSHTFLYDSLDGVPRLEELEPGKKTLYYTIAHEIGHAIGLDHIGALRKTPLCQLATAVEGTVLEGAHPSLHGGTSSDYCYMNDSGSGGSENIMGSGHVFTVENARPWEWAIKTLGYASYGYWRVSPSDPGPGTWVKM